MPLAKLIWHWNATNITLIWTKLQPTTFACNDGFQNKMYHILGILRFKFTIFGILLHLYCFGICVFACINLGYYTTNNNTFNDIVISNLTKLYNITCECSSTSKTIFFPKKWPFYFWKILPCMHNFDFDKFKH